MAGENRVVAGSLDFGIASKSPAALIRSEPLESRTLLNGVPFATVTYRGTLAVRGTAGADAITVRLVADQITATLNGSSLDFPADEVKRIAVDAQGKQRGGKTTGTQLVFRENNGDAGKTTGTQLVFDGENNGDAARF
jgi:hypothetical protein